MKKFLWILVLSLLVCGSANAGCDDVPKDGVDFSNCQFSEGQDLSRTYIPNSNLSFVSFIKVIFDKSIMMNSILINGNLVNVESVYIHKDYKPGKSHDIALIQLGDPVADVIPFAINTDSNELDKNLWFVSVL